MHSRLVVDEIALIGSRCGPLRSALDLLRRGRIDASSVRDDRFPLEEGVRAFERAAERGVLKVLLEPRITSYNVCYTKLLRYR